MNGTATGTLTASPDASRVNVALVPSHEKLPGMPAREPWNGVDAAALAK